MKKFDWDWSHTDPSIVIEYDYTPGDPGAAYFDDGSGEPPSPPYIDIVSFSFSGVDITNLMDMMMDQGLKEWLMRQI